MNSESGQNAGLGHRVTAAAAWMVGFRWIDRLIGVASLAILARLLTPGDFGVVGYATLVIGVLELFTGISTDIELIRHRQADRAHYDAAWTMNCLRGLAISALMLALARPAAAFFHEPKLAAVMFALAAIPLIQGLENVGIVDFRKQLQFDREFRFLLVSRLVGTVATLGLAFALQSYWALVAGSLLRTAFRVALSYGLHPFRPRFDFARVPEMFRFSRWMMLQNLATGLNDRLPGIVIGREWSSDALAYFNVSKEIAEVSTTEVRAPIRRVLFPGISQIADQRQRLAEVLVKSTGMLALLTAPIPLGIALVADDLVPLFLGTQWQPVVQVLQPLCVAGSIAALGTNSALAYLALDRSHLTAIAASLRAVVLLGLLLVVTPSYGIVGAAYAVAGVTIAMAVADYALASRLLQIDARRFLGVVWRPVAAALAMAAGVWLLRSGVARPEDLTGHARLLIGETLLGAAIYVLVVAGLWIAGDRREGPERSLVALTKDVFGRGARAR
ncbi:MAG TPA: lipopolysaccharide biosynthesis protein [Casimicrobiaceae bacterium]